MSWRCLQTIVTKGSNQGYLAESVNTNAVVIQAVFSAILHDAELVVSRTGYSGGTCLTRQAFQDITLDEVFDAVSKGDVFGLHPNRAELGLRDWLRDQTQFWKGCRKRLTFLSGILLPVRTAYRT